MNRHGRRSGGNRWESVDPIDRIVSGSVVDPVTGCWVWKRQISTGGYGMTSYQGRYIQAHRATYLIFKGEIPEGLELDHLCRRRDCVNPDHLEAVTRRENLLRGDTVPARRAAQTHCKRGHRFTDENTAVSRRGERICRKCKRASQWGAARGLGRDEAIALRYPPENDYGRVTVEDVATKIAGVDL